MVIDVSGSLGQSNRDQYQAAVQTASEFTRALLRRADDRGFLERFSTTMEATPILPRDQFLPLKVDLKPAGRTALLDAVRFGCDERMKIDSARNYLRVMVLLSDGEDNSSSSDIRQAIASAQRAGVIIFAVDTAGMFWQQFSRHQKGGETLHQLTSETGGFAFLDLDRGGLTKAFATIKEQIDNMYLLSYVPSDTAGPPYHSLKIVATSRKPKVKVRATHGYYIDPIVP
jgi:VWFA-related protein